MPDDIKIGDELAQTFNAAICAAFPDGNIDVREIALALTVIATAYIKPLHTLRARREMVNVILSEVLPLGTDDSGPMGGRNDH